jgi:hypothetical protein
MKNKDTRIETLRFMEKPEEAIKWAENEIKEYQNFIEFIKKNKDNL